jgi:hypothetical protein
MHKLAQLSMYVASCPDDFDAVQVESWLSTRPGFSATAPLPSHLYSGEVQALLRGTTYLLVSSQELT